MGRSLARPFLLARRVIVRVQCSQKAIQIQTRPPRETRSWSPLSEPASRARITLASLRDTASISTVLQSSHPLAAQTHFLSPLTASTAPSTFFSASAVFAPRSFLTSLAFACAWPARSDALALASETASATLALIVAAAGAGDDDEDGADAAGEGGTADVCDGETTDVNGVESLNGEACAARRARVSSLKRRARDAMPGKSAAHLLHAGDLEPRNRRRVEHPLTVRVALPETETETEEDGPGTTCRRRTSARERRSASSRG